MHTLSRQTVEVTCSGEAVGSLKRIQAKGGGGAGVGECGHTRGREVREWELCIGE